MSTSITPEAKPKENHCPVCHGEGYTSQYHSYPCTRCKGTGVIPSAGEGHAGEDSSSLPPAVQTEMQKLLEELEQDANNNEHEVSACCGSGLIEGSLEGPDGQWCMKCKRDTSFKGTKMVNESREAKLLSYIRTLEKEHREMRGFLETNDSCAVEEQAFQVCRSCIVRRKSVLSSLTLKP